MKIFVKNLNFSEIFSINFIFHNGNSKCWRIPKISRLRPIVKFCPDPEKLSPKHLADHNQPENPAHITGNQSCYGRLCCVLRIRRIGLCVFFGSQCSWDWIWQIIKTLLNTMSAYWNFSVDREARPTNEGRPPRKRSWSVATWSRRGFQNFLKKQWKIYNLLIILKENFHFFNLLKILTGFSRKFWKICFVRGFAGRRQQKLANLLKSHSKNQWKSAVCRYFNRNFHIFKIFIEFFVILWQ